MFTRKKSFYQRKAFYAVIALLLVFGFWVGNMPDNRGQAGSADAGVNYPVDEGSDASNVKTDFTDAENPNQNNEDETTSTFDYESEDQNQSDIKNAGYYLIKEIDGIIKIFYYDSHGNEQHLQNTDISFSLLSETDQKMFSEGVILNTEDDLTNLLQDFES